MSVGKLERPLGLYAGRNRDDFGRGIQSEEGKGNLIASNTCKVLALLYSTVTLRKYLGTRYVSNLWKSWRKLAKTLAFG